MAQTIQTRRDTAINWFNANPILVQGEMGFETDTVKIKFGDGVTHWNDLAYFTAAGGGGSNLKGTAVVDFGSTPGTNVVTTTVLNANVVPSSKVIVFMDSAPTVTHNGIEHSIVPIKFTVGNIVNGVSFDITSVSEWRLDGTFNLTYLII